MNSADIKIDLFRKLDALKGSALEEAYGVLLNFLNGKTEMNDWKNLSEQQQLAIKSGLEQLDNGVGKGHDDVLLNAKKKFLND